METVGEEVSDGKKIGHSVSSHYTEYSAYYWICNRYIWRPVTESKMFPLQYNHITISSIYVHLAFTSKGYAHGIVPFQYIFSIVGLITLWTTAEFPLH